MGVAMILVVFFHSSFDLSTITPLECLKNTGDIGVDIFFLMSGFGVYFSLQKGGTSKEFYKKRVIRILPAYFIAQGTWFVIFDIIINHNFLDFFLDISTLNFWINGRLAGWYIAACLLLYAFSPIWFKLRGKLSCISVVIVIVFYTLSVLIRLTSLNVLFGHLLIFTFRVPCYFIGLEFGAAYWNNKTIKVPRIIFYPVLLFSAAIVVVALGYSPWYIPWAFKYLAYLPLTIGIVIAAYKIPLNIILKFFGTYSLEIYLTHEKTLFFVSMLFRKLSFEKLFLLHNIVAIVVSLLVAWLLKKICNYVISKWK